jgi:hypothetical protein
MTERRPSQTQRSQHRRASPSVSSRKTPKEERMPIKFISIKVEDEQRDDEEDANLLVSLIQKRDWEGVSSRLQRQEGVIEASRALATKDFPLHIICKCGKDYKVSKYRSFKATASQTAEIGASGDISSRGGSTYSTPSGSVGSITTKDLTEASPMKKSLPTRAVLEAVMNAFPNAAKLLGSDDSTPLHW